VVGELKQKYFEEAARQIRTDASKDFIQGEPHTALRKLLATGIKTEKFPTSLPVLTSPARERF
jgi:hypothetical protein